MHIQNRIETSLQLQHIQHPVGVGAVGVGENMFTDGESLEDTAQRRVGVEMCFQRDVMNEGKVLVHVHGVIGLQAAQGGTVLVEKPVAQRIYLLWGEAHALAHEGIDAPTDGHP